MTLEANRLDEVAARYAALGYQVVRNPKGKHLPDFLAGFAPDLIAAKGNDRVLVEVKRRREASSGRGLAELAAAVAKQPRWRLDLVVFDTEDESAVPERYESLDRETLHRQLNESLSLIAAGHENAGALLLWATFEGTLRTVAAAEAAAVAPTATPTDMIKALIYHGVLDEDDLALAEALLEHRNALVHGVRAATFDQAAFKALAKLTQRLLAGDAARVPA